MSIKLLIFQVLIFSLCACSLLRKSPKSALKDGYYQQKKNQHRQLVYIDLTEDSLHLYTTKMLNHSISIDTLIKADSYTSQTLVPSHPTMAFYKNSMDIDFLTMPLKFRPSQQGVPAQLNTTPNGSIYLGFRTDRYLVSYESNPLKKYDRVINHYGLSFGIFGGLGNVAITPTTTNNYLSTEYDGVILTKGLAGIVAVNNFTVGVACGFDDLLNLDKKYWIYQTKPWLGLAFGLNLN